MIAPGTYRSETEPNKWPKLEQMNSPMHQVLADFIHGGDEELPARTAAVFTLFLSLWQNSGSSITRRTPSLVIINSAEEDDTSPLDSFAASLVNSKDFKQPQINQTGMFAHGTPKLAPTFMANAIDRMEERRKKASFPMTGQELQMLEEQFYAAQKTGFGHGRTRPYTMAWDEAFGLITERDCEVILRLETDDDRAAFLQDVVSDPTKLQAAQGFGPDLTVVSKRLCVSGALTPSEWDGEFTTHALELGLPMVFLPEPVRKTAVDSLHPAFTFMTSMLPNSFHPELESPANLVPDRWFADYGERLRKKLRALPGDYEFLMQRMARQLYPVSLRLANWAGNRAGASSKESEAIALDLCAHALRGLVISVAGLSWHGFGLNGDIPREEAVRVLDWIRHNGSVSLSDVARGTRISKETRDELLKRFAEEDLVKIDGKVVTATTYAEFVAALYGRKEFPEPPIHWKASAAKAKA